MSTTTAPTTTPTATADPSGPEAVADDLLRVFNDGATCILASIGHRVGLFDVMADLPPATSRQVADAAGLDERYVREWLGGMVTSRFVDYDPADRTYALRPDHAPLLTSTSSDTLIPLARYVGLMGAVESRVAEVFRSGGGLGYADYEGFDDIQASESAAVNDASLVPTIVPLTGELERLRAGICVADIGCGRGHAINLMAREWPASSFIGFDFGEEAIAAARAEAEAWGLTNTRFEVLDVATLDVEDAFDLVTTFDAVHDQAHPATVLANIRRSLRPGGTYLMVDMHAQSALEGNLDLPWATFLYAISTTHCMSVSLGQGGDGLGTVWGIQTAERMLHEAGFGEVVLHELAEDPFNAYFVARA